MIYSATNTDTDFYCPWEHPEGLFHHPRGRVHLRCLFKDFPRQTQVSGLSKLWLTFTLCAEERTSQFSCWRERKPLCVNSWGFLHFFIHNLQRNKWELYRRASESLNTGLLPNTHIPLTHLHIYYISASPGSSTEERASAGRYGTQYSQWIVGHVEPWSGKTLLWQIHKPWSLQTVSLRECTSFSISDSKINHPHYSGNMNLIFATKNL